jgi:hypothetical protein|tara:strand:+ start:172 stop:507 length:336 start_codon:yes stop_codon:yes gene_type:complete
MPEDIQLSEIPRELPSLHDGESNQLLERVIEVLESIDKSIDFLAAAMTGMDPLEIQTSQTALGRLALPRARNMPEPIERETKIDENITISNALLEEVIEEEIIKTLKRRVK